MSTEKELYEDIQRSMEAIRSKSEDLVSKAEFDNLNTLVKSLQDSVAEQNSVKHIEEASDLSDLEKKAALEFMAKGDSVLELIGPNAVRVKAVGDQVSLGVSAEGGYLLPKIFGPMVDGLLRKASPVRSMATVRRGTAMGFVTPFKTAHGTAGERTEMGATYSSKATQFNTISHSFYEVNAEQLETVWALQGDVKDFDLLNILLTDVVASMGEYEASKLLNGTTQNTLGQAINGVTTLNNGLLQQAALHDGTVDQWTNIPGTIAGVETGAADHIHPDDFINALATLHRSYRAKAKILGSNDLITKTVQTKDSQGRYLLSIGNAQEGFKRTLDGVEFVVDDFMPSFAAAGATPLALIGDFSALTICDASDIAWTVDPYTDKRFVKYLARFRSSSSLTNYGAIRGLYKKASA